MTRRLPWIVFGLWVAMALVTVGLPALGHGNSDGAFALAFVVLAGMGTLIARHRPANPVGWILLALALLVTASSAAEAVYSDYQGDPSPSLAIRLLLWVDEWNILVWFGLVAVLLPLLFPDGRVPSPRWRWVLWSEVAVVALALLGTAFGTERLNWGESATVANPLAVGGPLGEALRVVKTTSNVAVAAVVVLSLAAVVARFRRAAGAERQQLKWFGYAIGLLLAGLAAAALGEATSFEPLGNAGWLVFISSLVLGLPVAIAVAILRHRLLDVDVVINRTLVYGALTVTLGATYLGLVLLVGLAVGRSGFATAVSTLAVAALFRPARARIQEAVDRRFYRRRYDAARTLEQFGTRLRDELDLETLAADLRDVVGETVQPAHVSLWLRSER
jgi:hypothetical protein